MAKKATPGILFGNLAGKLGDMFDMNPREAVGKSYSSLANAGKQFYYRALQDFFMFFIFLIIGLVLFVTVATALIVTVFVINKSSYVTPVGPMRSGVYDSLTSGGISFVCSWNYEPLSFPNTATNATTARGWVIVNNLLRGFWCMWNHSPDYPNLWDQGLFQSNPFPPFDVNTYIALFWCTDLIIHTYQETGRKICPSCLYVPYMRGYFITNHRFMDAATAFVNPTFNIRPGDTVIIAKDGSTRGIEGDHVGMVWAVGQDYVITIESNNSVKTATYTIDAGRTTARWASLSIVGFGRME